MFFVNTVIAALALAASHVFAAPLEARQGYTSNCSATYTVKSGDSCLAIVNQYNGAFSLDDFYSWNPEIASGCYNLYPGEQVCVGVKSTTTPPPPPTSGCPAPVLSGLAADCDACYKVVEGDSCYAVDAAHGISLADFLAWNPSVDAGCTNLQIGYNYCVGVSA
ncbi:carbohydrate-binding module family 50 protein [Hypoxylon sp. CI-4A]|nr:carbohydrate-binding module family 50 protein [Hypoxylon sp. CI-4A]